jgi:hypothetical protein
MRKKSLAAALTGALAISLVGVAYADINDTTFDLSQFSVSPSKSGTKKKPKPATLKLGVKGGTKSGTGQPSTSTALKITLSKGIKWNGDAWPKSKRCDAKKAETARTDGVCPKGSKVGSGHVDAQGGTVNEAIDPTAYVLTNGNLGLWLRGAPLPLNVMLEGKVKGQVITIQIPINVQEPVTGVPTAIRTLSFGLNGKTKVKGKTRGVIETTACSGKKWTLKFENIMRDGKLSDSRSVGCKK